MKPDLIATELEKLNQLQQSALYHFRKHFHREPDGNELNDWMFIWCDVLNLPIMNEEDIKNDDDPYNIITQLDSDVDL